MKQQGHARTHLFCAKERQAASCLGARWEWRSFSALLPLLTLPSAPPLPAASPLLCAPLLAVCSSEAQVVRLKSAWPAQLPMLFSPELHTQALALTCVVSIERRKVPTLCCRQSSSINVVAAADSVAILPRRRRQPRGARSTAAAEDDRAEPGRGRPSKTDAMAHRLRRAAVGPAGGVIQQYL